MKPIQAVVGASSRRPPITSGRRPIESDSRPSGTWKTTRVRVRALKATPKPIAVWSRRALSSFSSADIMTIDEAMMKVAKPSARSPES